MWGEIQEIYPNFVTGGGVFRLLTYIIYTEMPMGNF